jgi:site-specific DNA recombinase
MKTVLYARHNDASFCKEQIALLTSTCEKEGWKIVGVYCDVGAQNGKAISWSARPEMRNLIARIQKGGIDQIIAESSSRFSRNQTDLLQIFESARFSGVKLFTIADGTLWPITEMTKDLIDATLREATGDHKRLCQRCHGQILRKTEGLRSSAEPGWNVT